MRLILTIPGIPIAMPRAKAARIGKHIHIYTPTTNGKGAARRSNGIAVYKATIRTVAAVAYTSAPLEGPIDLEIIAIFPRPTSMCRKRGDNPQQRKATKPDWDNVGKAVCDALNGLVWRDDAQISDAVVRKRIASGSEQPRTEIVIGTIE